MLMSGVDLPQPLLLGPVPAGQGQQDQARQAHDQEEGEKDEGQDNLLEPEPRVPQVVLVL